MGEVQENACDLCTFGVTVDEKRCCTNPNAVRAGGKPVAVRLVRAATGACGPEALFLDFPGLNP